MDVMLTTGGKKRTIVSLGANCGLDSLFENNACSFSTGKGGMRLRLRNQYRIERRLEFANDDVNPIFNGCNFISI